MGQFGARALPVLTHWISWNPGDEHLIAIGRDTILGIGDLSLFSSELIAKLNSKQVLTLAQASNARDPGTLAEIWKSSIELELAGHLALECSFTAELNKAGVTLKGIFPILFYGLGATFRGV